MDSRSLRITPDKNAKAERKLRVFLACEIESIASTARSIKIESVISISKINATQSVQKVNNKIIKGNRSLPQKNIMIQLYVIVKKDQLSTRKMLEYRFTFLLSLWILLLNFKIKKLISFQCYYNVSNRFILFYKSFIQSGSTVGVVSFKP